MILAYKRLAAYGIDFLLLFIVLIPMQFLLSGSLHEFRTGWEIERWVILTMSLPVWFYFMLCEYKMSQTIGKKVLKIEVTNMKRKKLGIGQVALRTFIKLVPWELTHIIVLIPNPWWNNPNDMRYLIFIPNLLMILYMVILLCTKGRKSLHDFFTGTRVIPIQEKTPKLSI